MNAFYEIEQTFPVRCVWNSTKPVPFSKRHSVVYSKYIFILKGVVEHQRIQKRQRQR